MIKIIIEGGCLVDVVDLDRKEPKDPTIHWQSLIEGQDYILEDRDSQEETDEEFR